MAIVIVVDTNVLRYALEAEKELKDEEETRRSYRLLLQLLKNPEVTLVANPETKREYYRHLETLKTEIRRRRIVPQSFSLLRLMRPKLKTVELKNYEFSFEGKEVGRKDIHLLNSAKSGALLFGEKKAMVLTFAEDVYRAIRAKNGKGIVVKIINLRSEEGIGELKVLWLSSEL
ncbi:hypothetical protein JCM16138_03820 [Thermococcus atlanticus]